MQDVLKPTSFTSLEDLQSLVDGVQPILTTLHGLAEEIPFRELTLPVLGGDSEITGASAPCTEPSSLLLILAEKRNSHDHPYNKLGTSKPITVFNHPNNRFGVRRHHHAQYRKGIYAGA